MVRPELQEAKVKLYEKKDRTRLVILFGVVLFAAFMMIALLNLIDSIQLSFRPVDAAEKLTNSQLALQRFLTWATVGVVAPPPPRRLFLWEKERGAKEAEGRASA